MLRRTKILTTLGPATDNPKVLADMLRAGADVVRVNFSHGDVQAHAKRVEMVRSVAEQVGKWVAVLGDLQGPKIRIERFIDGKCVLNEGDEFALDVSLDPRAGTATWSRRSSAAKRW
jgi:pyruvate kinase